MDGLAGWAVHFVQAYGELGLFVTMFLNCIGLPFSSEIILPLAGLAVQQGQMGLGAVMATACLAQLAGLALAYSFVRWRSGQHSHWDRLFKTSQLLRLEELFKQRGSAVLLIALCLPGLHGLAGYGAGLAKLSPARFLLLAGTGVVVWTGALVALGYYASGSLPHLYRTFHGIGWLALVAVGVAWLVWYSRHHRRR